MESEKIAGVKSYLRRNKTLAELKALADSTFADAAEQVTITTIGTEGTSSSGQVTFPRWLLLQVLEEIIAELEPAPASARALGTIVDRSGHFTIT
jgi:hypothetical protein